MNTSDIYQRVFEALWEGGIESVTKAAYEIMGMPITIADSSYTVIGLYPKAATGDEQWDTNEVNQPVICEAILAFQEDKHWSAIHDAGGVRLIDWGYFAGRPRYSALIEKNGKMLGSLAFLIGDQKQEEWHLEAIKIIAKAAAVAIERLTVGTDSDTLREVLITSLLSGNIRSYSQFLHMAENAAFKPCKKYVLAGMQIPAGDNEMFSGFVGSSICKSFKNSLYLQNKNFFYILLDGDKMMEAESGFKQMIDRLENYPGIFIAFSNPFENPLSLKRYQWQVDHVLEIAKTTNTQRAFLYYGDYVTDIAIGFIVSEMDEESLYHPMVMKLHEYDKEYGTEYLKTLKTYIQNLRSKSATADTLNIHRNTLSYRLEKMKEITGEDLQCPETARHLLLSFWYMDYKVRNAVKVKRIMKN